GCCPVGRGRGSYRHHGSLRRKSQSHRRGHRESKSQGQRCRGRESGASAKRDGALQRRRTQGKAQDGTGASAAPCRSQRSRLEQAQASGDAAKIKKAQRKLDSARKSYSDIEKSPL